MRESIDIQQLEGKNQTDKNNSFFNKLIKEYKDYGVYIDEDDPEHIKIKTEGEGNFIAIRKWKKIPITDRGNVSVKEIIKEELRKLGRIE